MQHMEVSVLLSGLPTLLLTQLYWSHQMAVSIALGIIVGLQHCVDGLSQGWWWWDHGTLAPTRAALCNQVNLFLVAIPLSFYKLFVCNGIRTEFWVFWELKRIIIYKTFLLFHEYWFMQHQMLEWTSSDTQHGLSCTL